MTGISGQDSEPFDLSLQFAKSPLVQRLLLELTENGHSARLNSDSGPVGALLAGSLSHFRTVVLIHGSQDLAERGASAARAFVPANRPVFTAFHSSAFLEEGRALAQTLTDRLATMDALASGQQILLTASIAGLLQHTYAPRVLQTLAFSFSPGDEINLHDTLHQLVRLGYERVDAVQQPGEFAARGGILDLFTSTSSVPIRIDLFGNQIETLRFFDPDSQRSMGSADRIRVLPACEPQRAESCLIDYLPSDALLVVDDAASIHRRWNAFEGEVRDQVRALLVGQEEDDRGSIESFPFLTLTEAAPRLQAFITLFINQSSTDVPWGNPTLSLNLAVDPAPHFGGDMESLTRRLQLWMSEGTHVWLITHQWPRVAQVVRSSGIDASAPSRRMPNSGSLDELSGTDQRVVIRPGAIAEGFVLSEANFAVLSDNEIFGQVKIQRAQRKGRETAPLRSCLELKPGDLAVHIDHGIGIFRGLHSMEVEGLRRDYLYLEYADGDKLYVPSDQVDRVQRYIGSEEHAPSIHRLGGADWGRAKRRARAVVEEMARELVALYAARASREGHAFGPDTPWQQELEDAFIYQETTDQLTSVQDIKQDLEASRPMDRLVCGDVGYGKTEVAIRAAFKVVMDGKQVAVLAPTTILAQQHLNTFSERLSGFPVCVEMLSRFRTHKQQKETVDRLKQGSVDIVIGTHRLLSKDVAFKDLGLVIVDEEHRFGVAHKERLKQLREMVDVLTLTATPIPRTLHMAISTIRDLSVMNQAPEGRSAVRTYLREYSDSLVRQCILRELERNGQVYFVHNRVESMPHILEHLRKLAPEANMGMGHGQMAEHELEQVMLDFYSGKYDVLCCTTIIESGLDIPNVNTIIINDADKLGLAQMYQLRGRVGRSNRQAYCYLLHAPDKEITEVAQKRLSALREFSELGSGFRIAMRDLEIRGAGNLLGSEQHGVMMTVGFDMYCQMIADAVRTLRNEPPPPPPLPPVDLPIGAYLPGDYISAETLRIDFYKRLNTCRTLDDLSECEGEMKDRFGALPTAAQNLVAIIRLRVACRTVGITSITSEKTQVVLRLGPKIRLSPAAIMSLGRKHPDCRFLNDRAVVPVEQYGPIGAATRVIVSLGIIRDRRREMGIG